ncbi:MAG: methionyl-tRNA formyltransferase [Chthoniobacterales bacterium]|nr:methionyl-tRNA formyltransferase [Chthoniobacterales bacterium]
MRVVFIGTGEIGLPVLRWLVEAEKHQLVALVTQPDKPVGRDQRITPTATKAIVAGLDIPVLQPQRIKHAEAVHAIQQLQPEVIVVMAYGQILPRAVLEIPTLACLNLHASLLPKHRGAAPIQAAIASGDPETGLTVMYMAEGLDTGDMLLQSRIKIAPDETGGSLHDRLAELAPAALSDALQQLAAGTAPRLPQNDAEATYAPKLEREHGAIDWREPVEVIECKIRAFHPWPGAYSVLRDAAGRDRKLKILRARPAAAPSARPAGELFVADGRMAVAATGGTLLLEEVQLEGKKRMPAADLLRGNPWLAQAAIVPPTP